MEIKSKDVRVVPIADIEINPKNRNIHPPEQIDRLAKIINYQGFRNPVIISNRSGKLVSGHGRLLAAKALGMSVVPAIYEDFDDEDQEYAAGISENSIASWAELDLAAINIDIPELGPFDLDLLGLKDFTATPEFEPGTIDDQGKLDEKKPVECPACGHEFTT